MSAPCVAQLVIDDSLLPLAVLAAGVRIILGEVSDGLESAGMLGAIVLHNELCSIATAGTKPAQSELSDSFRNLKGRMTRGDI